MTVNPLIREQVNKAINKVYDTLMFSAQFYVATVLIAGTAIAILKAVFDGGLLFIAGLVIVVYAFSRLLYTKLIGFGRVSNEDLQSQLVKMQEDIETIKRNV